jgi:predicted RNase H-like HicB family nuclease
MIAASPPIAECLRPMAPFRQGVYRSRHAAIGSSRSVEEARVVKTCTATVERDPETGIYVGYVPGFPGAHSQGDTLDELEANLQEVVRMLAEPRAEAFGVRLTPPLEW